MRSPPRGDSGMVAPSNLLGQPAKYRNSFAVVPTSTARATGSFPFQFTDPNEAQNGPQFQEILPEYERTWQLLNNANIAVNSSITGTGGLTITDTTAGTITLNAANSYTGTTTVTSGSLIVNGTLANTVLTVLGGGVLGGTGTIGNGLTPAMISTDLPAA